MDTIMDKYHRTIPSESTRKDIKSTHTHTHTHTHTSFYSLSILTWQLSHPWRILSGWQKSQRFLVYRQLVQNDGKRHHDKLQKGKPLLLSVRHGFRVFTVTEDVHEPRSVTVCFFINSLDTGLSALTPTQRVKLVSLKPSKQHVSA